MDYYFIIVFLQSCSLLSSLISASTIIRSPQDTDAFAGGNTTLYCTVQDLGSNIVVWRTLGSLTEYSYNRQIVAPEELKPDRFKITGDDAEGTFNLEITEISISFDSGRSYQCVIKDVDDMFVEFSTNAQLGVHEVPSSPICTVAEYDDLLEGEGVTFECTFQSTITKVEMNLTRNGNNTLSNEIVDPDVNFGISTSTFFFNVTADDNDALLRCSVDHQIFSMTYECSVTLNVKYKPIVEITKIGMISDGNASFTCGAVSNPDATQFDWSLCLGNGDNECMDAGNGIGLLTVERDDSEGLATECEVFGSNVSCYIFKNEGTELDVYVILRNENLTIPENMTVAQCLLICSVSNSIGEGNDEYTIDNTICLMAVEPTTIMPTTPMLTTLPTTAFPATTIPSPSTSDNIVINGTSTTMPTVLTYTDDGIMEYYYIIGGLAGGTVVLFLLTIIILICRNAKTEPDEDTVAATQWTHYANNGYDDNGGFDDQKDKVLYTPDNPFKTFGKEDKSQDTKPEQDDSGNVHDNDTLPMNDDSRQEPPHEPEGEVGMDADGDGDAVAIRTGESQYAEGDVGMDADGDGDAVAIRMGEPQYAAVNKPHQSSFGRDEPQPDGTKSDVLESVDGGQYISMDFSDQPQSDSSTFKGTVTERNSMYAEVDHNARPSITQI